MSHGYEKVRAARSLLLFRGRLERKAPCAVVPEHFQHEQIS